MLIVEGIWGIFLEERDLRLEIHDIVLIPYRCSLVKARVCMESLFLEWLREYGYIILFVWSILEGEIGLIMAGILCHSGLMNIYLAIIFASLGGFVGDQIYFYLGYFNKRFIYRYFKTQRRKFALAHLLLLKYGVVVIFMQRYMYGMRTIIPASIGAMRYSPRKYAMINSISALIWASVIIILAYYFGEELLHILDYLKNHYYLMIPLIGVLLLIFFYFFHKITQKSLQKNKT